MSRRNELKWVIFKILCKTGRLNVRPLKRTVKDNLKDKVFKINQFKEAHLVFTFLVDGELHPLAIVPHGGWLGAELPQRCTAGAGGGERNTLFTSHRLLHYVKAQNFTAFAELW